MKALVTGAGGFVGGAVARALRARGDEVRGFSRAPHPELSALGVDHRQGDVADGSAVADAVRGVDVVFHAAAKVAAGGRFAIHSAISSVVSPRMIRVNWLRSLMVLSLSPSTSDAPRSSMRQRSALRRPPGLAR